MITNKNNSEDSISELGLDLRFTQLTFCTLIKSKTW